MIILKNKEIREAINNKRLKYYEVANALGISRFTFSVWLSEELPENKKKEILEVIEKIEI